MTIQEYINNPSGGKTSVMTYRSMYSNLYNDKWSKIMTRENGRIDYQLYMDKDTYYAHIKIPSEVVPKFYYDVVLKFVLRKGANSLLNGADVQFFSNDPHFNYTYTHAFIENKLAIIELKERMSKASVKNKASEKNPKDEIGYVKSLYFAFIVMQSKGLFNLTYFKTLAKKFDKKELLSNVMDTEQKVADRVLEASKLKPKKDKKDVKQVNTSNPIINPEVKRGGTLFSVTKPLNGNGVIKPTNTKTSNLVGKTNLSSVIKPVNNAVRKGKVK